MSINAVERVLWEFGRDPARIAEFRKDPDAYLAPHPLDPDERQMIKDVDVKRLADRGVNTYLTVMVWPLMKGPDKMPYDYLERMGATPRPGNN